ncbi:MAG: hypothetical protein ACFCU6_09485 [Balneolaceae bacterium]
MNLKTGIVTALSRELHTLTDSPLRKGEVRELSDGYYVCLSGVGKKAARKAGQKLIKSGVNLIISWGTAASLHQDLKTGTLVIPKRIITSKNDTITTDEAVRRQIVKLIPDHLNYSDGNLCTADFLLTESAQKISLGMKRNSVAADMESGVLAELCSKKNIPFVVIRSISDSSAMVIPTSVTKNMNSKSDINIFPFLRSAIVRPDEWLPIFRLAKGFGRAKKSLSEAAKCLFPVLLQNLSQFEDEIFQKNKRSLEKTDY